MSGIGVGHGGSATGGWNAGTVSRRVVLAGGVALAVTACAPGKRRRGSGSDAFTVTAVETTDLEAWSPYAQSSTPSYSRWGNIFEPLVDYDYEAKKIVPVLATSWTNDGLDWIFKLRQGVKFHDGSDFTAKDVIHSFTRMMKDGDSLQASNFIDIDTMTAVDDHTLKIRTKEVTATLLQNIGPNRFISSKTAFDKYGNKDDADRHPSGTGPYKFVAWNRGSDLTLEKYEGYRTPNAGPDKLVFKVIPEATARAAALERGEVDLIREVPVQDVPRLSKLPNASVVGIDGIRMLMFPLSPRHAPLDDVRVRRAICYAVDVKAIIKDVLKNQATFMNGPVPSSIFGYDPNWKPYRHDPAKAKQLLAAAGHAGGFELKLTTPVNRYPKDREVAQAVAQQLASVGIKATLSTPEFGTLSNDMTDGKLDFYQISRGGYFDGAEPMEQYFRTGVTERTGYSNPKVDKLLDASDAELDEAKREKLLQQAGQILLDDAAAIFMCTYKDVYGVSKEISWKPNANENVQGIDMKRAD